MNTLQFLYKTKAGRLFLKPLISKPVSELSGKLMDSRISRVFIKPFIKANEISVEDYVLDDIVCFNDFFCRRIKNGLRPVDMDDRSFAAPCDGFLSICRIDEGTVLKVKQSRFSIRGLLRDRKLAESFDGGYCLVFRLCVNHYHRYIFFDSGKKYRDRHIDGVYHTVRPIALEEYPVFVENTRDYSVIDTKNFGRCVQMEVGAMLVGRIVNEKSFACRVTRGEEKGHFEYGGSTIIVLVGKDRLKLREDLRENIGRDVEIPVVMGEKLGSRVDTE